MGPVSAGQQNGQNGHDAQRRAELGRYLRARRAGLSPEEVGLPSGRRRRTPGLRREELAALAGVGVTWYTWLEQGRPITVSTQVLDSLSRALRLDAAEHTHLFVLARGALPAPPLPATDNVEPSVWQILAALGVLPAYVANARWDVVAWNAAACRVFQDFAALSPADRNLLWFMFTNPLARQLYVEWDVAARTSLGLFRASTGRSVGEAWFNDLVEALRRASLEFQTWWACADIAAVPEQGKELNHALVGRLALRATPLQVAQAPDLWMLVFTPVPGTDTGLKLERLMQA